VHGEATLNSKLYIMIIIRIKDIGVPGMPEHNPVSFMLKFTDHSFHTSFTNAESGGQISRCTCRLKPDELQDAVFNFVSFLF